MIGIICRLSDGRNMHKQTMLIEDKTYCLKLTINRIIGWIDSVSIR